MCKQISGAFFQTKRYVVNPDFSFDGVQRRNRTFLCKVWTSSSPNSLRTFWWARWKKGDEKAGGFDLKVIPITNPPQRIGQPRIFDFKDPVYVKVVKVKVMLAPAWVGREQERVSREQGSWHLWGCHECRWSSEYERNTSQVLKRALYYPTAHNVCADEVEKPCRKNRRTWHPDVTAILSLQGDEVEWLAEKFGGPEWGELFCCRAQAGKGQLGKLHHWNHGPRWFPTGFFSPINGLNWCIGKHCGAPGILLLKLEMKNGVYIYIIYIWFYSVCTSKSMILYENTSFQWQCCLTRMFLFFSQHWNLQGEPDDRFWSAGDSFIPKKWLKISGFAWGYIL